MQQKNKLTTSKKGAHAYMADQKKDSQFKNKKKRSKVKKAVEKIKKNGYESFGSDENVDDQYKKTKAMSRQRQAFYFSGGLPLKDRIQIFRNDFSEFNTLDDE